MTVTRELAALLGPVAAVGSTSLTSWLVVNARLVLIASVLLAIAFDVAHRLVRRSSVDARSLTTTLWAALAWVSVKGVVTKLAGFALMMWVYGHHRLLDLDPLHPLVWLTLFVGRDFAYYWIHRAEHRVRMLWASHLVHHSSESFTFTSAVRLPWMEAVYKPVLALWVPLLGFHPAVAAAIGALVLVVGQLQHTELGRRRTWLDLVFVTPSAHRVHHGSNSEYLDRNFGSMLIIWDRLFGTYVAEARPVVYGLAGGKAISTPTEAFVGGYRELLTGLRGRGGRARLRYLVSAPS